MRPPVKCEKCNRMFSRFGGDDSYLCGTCTREASHNGKSWEAASPERNDTTTDY